MNEADKKKRMYLHGECIIKEIETLPKNLTKRNDKDSIMIAESETVGNEHRIKVKDGIEFYEDENGILYMKNTLPTEVYCIHTERHDTIEIPQGIWEIDKAVEYDYTTRKISVVTD
jgi:capsule polysaccharide export protein KpsE/RkpR